MKHKIFLFAISVFIIGNIFATAPAITSFSPSSGPVGTLVTIIGTNLNSTTACTIGGKAAIVTSNDYTFLVGMVMPGAVTGTIVITTAGGTVTSSENFTVTATLYPTMQQGNKLVGTGNSGAAQQGISVAISADGNTAIVGGWEDNNLQGAVWIYIRSGSTWTQQGNKLVGPGGSIDAKQGTSVSISADGNTAAWGGIWNDGSRGAIWVYTRSGNTWSQQSGLLVGSGYSGFPMQGSSVALSADGNTVVSGGPEDNSGVGAAWVFTRSGNTWSQQGSKLVGTGSVGTTVYQGTSVSISADGNTVIIGGSYDNTGLGAAWVWTRSGSTWTQQGSKLIGTGNVGAAGQGSSVAVSADGNKAIVGGNHDNSGVGAAWIFTRAGSTWTQQGSKLVSNDWDSIPYGVGQGVSVAISADGKTAVVGGYHDNGMTGAAWTYSFSGSSWSQKGNKLLGTGTFLNQAYFGISIALSADGTTSIVGGYGASGSQGAAWVFIPCDSTVISVGPSSATQSVCRNEPLDPIFVIASGSNLTYQWYSNTSNSNSGGTLINVTCCNGAQSDILYIPVTAVDNATYYYCVVTGFCRTVTSAVSGLRTVGTIIISQSTAAQTQCLNGTFTPISVTAGDPGSISYQWFSNTSSSNSNGTSLGAGNGAQTNTYTPQATTAGTLYYYCEVTGTCPWPYATSAVSGAFITNITAINSQATATQTQCLNSTFSPISVTATGPGLSYQWYRNASNSNAGGISLGSSNGAQTNSYTPQATSLGTIYYYCVVAGSCSTTTSAVSGAFITQAICVTISSFTPTTGSVGTLVTITGVNMGSPTAFTIGGATAIVISNTGTTLVGMVMPGATTGAISITTALGTATGSGNFTVIATPYPGAQQGNKLLGADNISAQLGSSVAVSADGNTAIVGGYNDWGGQGAAWIFTRSGSTWTQQGSKLVGTGAAGNGSYQGGSVAISADGNTVIVGGYMDNFWQGAAWIFTRSGSTWTQQGNKLVGTGGSIYAYQGSSVSISADGNTVVSGGPADNSWQGATWVFTRSGSTWSQQGNKLADIGASSTANQGSSVSLSANGNTVLVGGPGEGAAGSVWVYTRSGNTWSQQGSTLVGTNSSGGAMQGSAVAISADGNTAIEGGYWDNSTVGAAWIFTRSGNTWSQQGSKLVGSGNTGAAAQGMAVAISADGNTAILGGNNDASGGGAAWVFARSGSTWTQRGSKLVGTGNTGFANQGTVAVSADGTTLMMGGPGDNTGDGAVWVFIPCTGTTINSQSTATQTKCLNATFTAISVTASGPGLTYQWYSNASNSNSGGTSLVASNGAQTNTYTPQAAVAGTLYYYCVVTGSCGIATSAVSGAFITNVATAISSQSTATQTQCLNATFTAISVTASGAGLTYQWYSNASNSNSGGTSLGSSNGAQTNTYTPQAAAAGTLYYYCVVTGSCGTATSVVSGAFITTNCGSITISSFTPNTGSVGTLVTITGTNLGSPTAFTIGGATAIVISNTGTTLVGMVMPGATTGIISITTATGTATGTGNFSVTATPYPGVQQGNKLVGTNSSSNAYQGTSVAVSADGNTAIVGGNNDNTGQGALWIYTRTGNTWSQQGNKLVGTGNTGAASQGNSVAVSADGNTILVGGPWDNSGQGAVWVFTRSGNTWSQQGNKLVGTGGSIDANQGSLVSISADGNTILVGGPGDNSWQGATWVFTRSGSTWTQQGSKLVGTGGSIDAGQGYYVALSADGNTAIVGGPWDNSAQGAAWVYIRSGSSWSQEGNKLVGTGNTGAAYQGTSVAVSADGNTILVCGPGDSNSIGATWVFARSGSTWTQQGSKLVGTGNTGAAQQGVSVSISADGNTAIVGGYNDNSLQGATWVFTRSGGTWTQQGSKLVGTGNVGGAGQGYYVTVSADGSTAIVGGCFDNTNLGAAWVFVPCVSPTAISSQSTATQTQCINGTYTAISVTATGTGTLTYQWYSNASNSNSGGTSLVSANGAQTDTYTPQAAAAGTLYYYCVVTGNCGTATSTVSGAFLVNAASFAAQTHHVSELVANGTGIKWYDAASGGNLLSSGTALVNNQHYYASQTVNGCESTSRYDVTVAVDPTPCAPTASSPQTPGAGASVAQLTVLTGQSIRWYLASSGGTALPSTTLLQSGSHTYYASQTVSCTESASRVAVTVTVP